MTTLAELLGDSQTAPTPVPAPAAQPGKVATTLADVLGQAPQQVAVDPMKAWDEDPDILAWRTDMMYNYGEDPQLSENAGEYNMLKAVQSGLRPKKMEDGTYHWPSSTPDGEILKTPNHPTYWKELLVRQRGINPDQVGIQTREEAEALFGLLSVDASAVQPRGEFNASVTTGLRRMRQETLEGLRQGGGLGGMRELLAGATAWLPGMAAKLLGTGMVDEKTGAEAQQKLTELITNAMTLDPEGKRFSELTQADFEVMEKVGGMFQAIAEPARKAAVAGVEFVDPAQQPLEGKRKALTEDAAELLLFTAAPVAIRGSIRALQGTPLWRRLTIKEKGLALQDFHKWAESQRGLPPEQVIENARQYWGEGSIHHEMAKAAAAQFDTQPGAQTGPVQPETTAQPPVRTDIGPVRAQYQPASQVYPRYYGVRPPVAALKPEQDFSLGAGPYDPAGERVGEPYAGPVALRGETRPAELTKEGVLVGDGGPAIPLVNRAIPVGDPYGSDFELVFGAGALAQRGQTLPARQGSKAIIPHKIPLSGNIVTDNFLWDSVRNVDSSMSDVSRELIDRFIGVPHNARELGIEAGLMFHKPLETAIKNNSPAYTQLQTEFEPIRKALISRYGDRITLYRGQSALGKEEPRQVLSWTSNPVVAASFIGGVPYNTYHVRMDYQDGSGVYYPDEYYTLPNGKDFETGDVIYSGKDGESSAYAKVRKLEEKFPQWKFYVDTEWTDPGKDKGAYVASASIPVNDIVWVSNRAGQQEFIVKNSGNHAINPVSTNELPRRELVSQDISLGVESITGNAKLAAEMASAELPSIIKVSSIPVPTDLGPSRSKVIDLLKHKRARNQDTIKEQGVKNVIQKDDIIDILEAFDGYPTDEINKELAIREVEGAYGLPRRVLELFGRALNERARSDARNKYLAEIEKVATIQDLAVIDNLLQPSRELKAGEIDLLMEDTGKGISQDVLDRVTEQFIQSLNESATDIPDTPKLAVVKRGTSPQPPATPEATPLSPPPVAAGGEVPSVSPEKLQTEVEQMAVQAISEADRAELMRELVARKRLAGRAKAELSVIEQQREGQLAPPPRVVTEAEKAARKARQDMMEFLGEKDDGQALTPDPDSMFSDDVMSLDEMAMEEQAAEGMEDFSDSADYIHQELNDLFGPESGRITLDMLLLGQGERLARVWQWVKQMAARAYRAGKSLIDYLRGNKVKEATARDIDAFFQRMKEQSGSAESFAKPAAEAGTSLKVEEVGKLANWTGVFSIEHPFRRIGAAETGFHLKNIHSVHDLYAEWGLRIGRQMTKMDLAKGTDFADAAIAAERPGLVKAELRTQAPNLSDVYSTEQQEALRRVIKPWEDVRDQMFLEYQQRGRLTRPWPDSFLNRNNESIRKLLDLIKGEKNPTVKAQLQQQVEDLRAINKLVQDTEYTPIMAAWFYSQDQTNPANLIKVLRILNTKKRETPTIKYLIDQGIITREQADLRDIVAHYMRRVGKDFALDNLLKAALKDGLIKKGYFEGWGTLPVSKYPVLRGYSINPHFQEVLEAHLESGRRPGPAASVGRAIEQGLHLVKAFQFINPLMLPGYDVHQGIMIGTMTREGAAALAGAAAGLQLAGPTGLVVGAFAGGVAGMGLHAKTWKKAWKSVTQKDNAFKEAMENGLASKPFSLNFDDVSRQLAIIKDPFMGRLMEAVKQPPIGLLKELYAPMWTAAWWGSDLIRMVSYHHLRDNGYSAREAAQLAAKAHGDYAGIPPQTKRLLNAIFFTPSFEIAMGKWYASMLGSYYKAARKMFETGADVKTGWGNIPKGTKAMMAGVIALAIVNFASDYNMKEMGYEPVPGYWGLKYRRKVRTAEGEKEMVITLSSPSNRVLQYYSLAQRLFDPTSTDPTISRILQATKFKFHPVWRIGAELAWNQGPDGEQIYNPFDSSLDRNLATLQHVLRSGIRLYGMFDAHEVNQEQEDEIRKSMGEVVYWGLRPFTFSYLRGNADARAAAKINNIKSELMNTFKDKKETPTREQLQRALDMMDEVMRERDDANRQLR